MSQLNNDHGDTTWWVTYTLLWKGWPVRYPYCPFQSKTAEKRIPLSQICSDLSFMLKKHLFWVFPNRHVNTYTVIVNVDPSGWVPTEILSIFQRWSILVLEFFAILRQLHCKYYAERIPLRIFPRMVRQWTLGYLVWLHHLCLGALVLWC